MSHLLSLALGYFCQVESAVIPCTSKVIVPKLDLMEQFAQILEKRLPDRQVSRVGTGFPANLSAEVFLCVRNSAWQLENLTLDLLLLDEAHHYEPLSGLT